MNERSQLLRQRRPRFRLVSQLRHLLRLTQKRNVNRIARSFIYSQPTPTARSFSPYIHAAVGSSRVTSLRTYLPLNLNSLRCNKRINGFRWLQYSRDQRRVHLFLVYSILTSPKDKRFIQISAATVWMRNQFLTVFIVYCSDKTRILLLPFRLFHRFRRYVFLISTKPSLSLPFFDNSENFKRKSCQSRLPGSEKSLDLFNSFKIYSLRNSARTSVVRNSFRLPAAILSRSHPNHVDHLSKLKRAQTLRRGKSIFKQR